MAGWTWLALGSAGFAGLTAILGKLGVERVPPLLATLIRTVVVLVLMAALAGWRKEWPRAGALDQRGLVFLVLSGLTTGLSWLCYFQALHAGPASVVAPLDKLSLPVAIVLAVVVLGEHLSGRQWAGTALMTVGALLLAAR